MQAKVGNLQTSVNTTILALEPITLCELPGADDICGEIFRLIPDNTNRIAISQVCKQFNRNAFWCVTTLDPRCQVPAAMLHIIAPRITKVVIDDRVKKMLMEAAVVFPNVTQVCVSSTQYDVVDDAVLSFFPNVEILDTGVTELITNGGLLGLRRVVRISLQTTGNVTSEGLYHMSGLKHITLHTGRYEILARGIEFDKLQKQFPGIGLTVSTPCATFTI